MPRHRVLIPLRWSDMDAYGHVNNVQFLRLLEDARVRVFGMPGDDGGPIATGLIVARTEIEYFEQLTFSEQPVAVDMWVTHIGGADFDLGYEFTDARDAEPSGPADPAESARVYARAESTQVVYDLATAAPRRMTAEERKRLEGLRGDRIRWKRRRRSER